MAESPVIYLLGKLASFFENEIQHMRESPEEMIALKGEFERIKAFLRVADSTEEVDGEVKIWIKQIREVAYDAEDALDEFKLLLAHDHEGRGLLYKIPCCVRNMKARYRLAAAIRSISSRMKAICEDNQRLYEKLNRAQHGSSSACEDSTWQDHRADAVLVEKTGLVGIEEPKEKLTQWLVSGNSEQEVISVVGMGGLGKTTLTKEVFDGPVVKKHFSVCAWVTLSPSSKTEELLMDMLQQIASSIMQPVPSGTDTMNINWLKRTIRSFLQGRRSRYLIVLDDVWHMDRWDAVKYALPNNNLGSRVMITTRNSDLALASCTEFNGKVYKMQPLPVEQSWELFCRKIFKKNSCPSQLEEICTDILKKCEGLPLAIVAISRVLATKDQWRINEWDLVRRCLPSEINGNDRLKNMKKVLSLSFNDLPYYLKSCLLQISVFPEGHVIERMRLIRHWVAEGFVEMEDAKTMEEVADDYLNELVNRSLIQVVEIDSDGRIKSCRIHGLLLKIINLKSRDQNFATILDKQSSTWPDRIRRCSVHNEFRLGQQNMLLSHLRSLYMFGEDNCSLYSILSGDLKLLCVLDLQNAPLRRFPPQVVDMRSLKFLSLRNTQIQTVPTSIGRLQNLETLDLKHTRVTSLPMEIMKLQRLCHLLVYHHHTVGYAHYKYGFSTPARIGAFQSLQKLGRIYVDDDRTNNVISELGKLNQLRRLCILKLKKEDGKRLCWSIAKLTNLQALSVFSSEDDDIDLQDLSSPPPLLQRIYLKGQMQALPHWIANMHGLVKLHLRWCLLKEDPLPSLQDLPNLVHLELLQVHDWQTLCFKAKGFQKLKILVLDYYEELTFVQIEEEAMSNLEKLMIQRCKQLKSMPSGIEHLTKLKVLQFFDMRFFDMPKELQLDERDEGYQKVAHVPVLRYGYWRDGAWETTVTNNIADSHRKFGFKTLGEIGALQCLQKLCHIVLTKNKKLCYKGFTKNKKLCNIEANDVTSSILIRQIRKLIQLRRLCILRLKKEDGGELCVSIAKLTNLRALSVSSFEDAEIDLQNLDSLPQLLQRVYLRGKLQTLPHWIAKLPSLAKLHLKRSHLEEDPMSALQSMPNLVNLELLQVYSWQKLCFKAKGFKKLKILGLDCFEELTLIQVEEGAMPCLEKWSIQRCKCLKNVPSGIEYLSKLKVLELFDMP